MRPTITTVDIDGARIGRLGEVAADLGGELVHAVRIEPDEGFGHGAVQVASPALQDPAIRRLLRQRVPEGEAALGLAAGLAHKVDPLQGRELTVELAIEPRSLPEDGTGWRFGWSLQFVGREGGVSAAKGCTPAPALHRKSELRSQVITAAMGPPTRSRCGRARMGRKAVVSRLRSRNTGRTMTSVPCRS